MLDYDAHLHAFQVDPTEQSSRDRNNLAKEHWRAYLQGRAELELLERKGVLTKQEVLDMIHELRQREPTAIPPRRLSS